MTLVADQLDRDSQFAPKVMGLIGISTAFDVGHNVPKWQLMLAGAIAPVSRFLFYRIPNYSHILTIRGMNVELISPNQQVQDAIHADELVYKGRIPLNTSAQVYNAGLAALQVISQLRFPSLLLHSIDDEVALAPRQQDIGNNVQLRLFKALRHNCIDGLAREAVVARRTITKFIVDKL